MRARTFLALATLLAATLAGRSSPSPPGTSPPPVASPPVTSSSAAPAAPGALEQRLYLSGTDRLDPVLWDFRCRRGRGCGAWTRIPVPSQWELAGFGTYDYGHEESKAADRGLYRHRFTVPAAWRGRRVELVFEGVMTDASVLLDGVRVGPTHRGGFYRFSYDVSDRLRYGGSHLLEVLVAETSADRSVEAAERDADYWTFGGIYRPVYLRALPPEHLEEVAVDARHDGGLRLRAEVRGLDAAARLVVQLADADGGVIGKGLALPVAGDGEVELAGRFHGVLPWSAEQPRLYRLRLELRRGGEVLHRLDQRIGFRTVEVRPGEGLFVNGVRTLLRGVNRHAFWPDSGRTLDAAIDRADAERMKAMNLNAVRTAHYPPDPSFLAACDELGLYVIDELAGWHDAYDTEAGAPLVGEMVRRDRNHPSVILWANGNEGGWNPALDAHFAKHDPLQRRVVLHPHSVHAGFDARHYPTWDELVRATDPTSWWARLRSRFSSPPLVMPTEVLHALYDGGSAAGLADYWRRIRDSPLGVGLFLWAWSDEAVVRTDRGGQLDAHGSHAPDGILGPYREATGQELAVRALFAPVAVRDTRLGGPRVELVNRFTRTDLADCRVDWSLLRFPSPAEEATKVLATGSLAGPPAPPGSVAQLALPLPATWRQADALRLEVRDPHGRRVSEQVLPRLSADQAVRELVISPSSPSPSLEQGDGLYHLAVGADPAERVTVVIDASSGELRHFGQGGRSLPLAGAPHLVGGTSRALGVRAASGSQGATVEARHAGALRRVVWRLSPGGWLRLSVQYDAGEVAGDVHGIALPLPEAAIRGLRFLGEGPARVWRNRLAGGVLGVWRKLAGPASTHGPIEELAGYYAGVRWAVVETEDGPLTLALGEDLYLGVGVPRFPADAADARARDVPDHALTVLRRIPAIGTKFHPAEDLGPMSAASAAAGFEEVTVWLYPGIPPAPARLSAPAP